MNKSFFKVIDSVIVFNCKILNLEQPTVTYEPPNKFATPTTKAGINPDKNVIAINIDAWRTTNSNEEGKVIAKINLSNSEVEYVDEKAKTDAYAQTVIRRVLNAVV